MRIAMRSSYICRDPLFHSLAAPLHVLVHVEVVAVVRAVTSPETSFVCLWRQEAHPEVPVPAVQVAVADPRLFDIKEPAGHSREACEISSATKSSRPAT